MFEINHSITIGQATQSALEYYERWHLVPTPTAINELARLLMGCW